MTFQLGRPTLAGKMQKEQYWLDSAEKRKIDARATNERAIADSLKHYHEVLVPHIEAEKAELLKRPDMQNVLDLADEVAKKIAGQETITLNRSSVAAYYANDYGIPKPVEGYGVESQTRLMYSESVAISFEYYALKNNDPPTPGSEISAINFKITIFPVVSEVVKKSIGADYFVHFDFGGRNSTYLSRLLPAVSSWLTSYTTGRELQIDGDISHVDKLADKIIASELFRSESYKTHYHYQEARPESEREPWGGSGPTN